MDRLDKTLLLKLLCNSRTSYRKLATQMGVTCPTIKRRVDQLVEAGIIERFTVELSQETLGVAWAYAEIITDLSENRDDLIHEVCAHESTKEIYAVGPKRYLVFAELPYPDGVYEYGRFLRGINGVRSAELVPARQIPSGQLSYNCKYASRGKKAEFSFQQMNVLGHLAADARMPFQELAEKTGYKQKRLRRILKELDESGAVHFTISMNNTPESCISFILKIGFHESKVTPRELASWIEEEFGREYWISFLLANKPVLINYMTTDNLSKIETIIRRMKTSEYIDDVETMLIYHIEKNSGNGLGISQNASPTGVLEVSPIAI
ncbi:MAG: winged helix-turn-helix transcriptional regulator [Candidatus Thorarchaeota archaeon]|nr:winged helix-turn-helix transcriptional regulator [Candidatus Thorarchaeota archaeon]